MGVSPRLLPVAYGKSINNSKRALRHQAVQQLAEFLTQKGFVLLDLDLTSCYTSILLGLYPQDLEFNEPSKDPGYGSTSSQNSTGMEKGITSINQPIVCVYASFFLGGNNAMMSGVFEGQRQELGEKEFKAAPFNEECYALAQNPVSNSSVIADLRAVSKKIHDPAGFPRPPGISTGSTMLAGRRTQVTEL